MVPGFCSPPKVKRTVSLTKDYEVVENPMPKLPPLRVLHPQHEQFIPCSRPTLESRTQTDFPGNNISVEGVLVDQAVDTLLSLPQVVMKVSAVQKENNNEIHRQELHLRQLRNDVKLSQAKCDKVMAEILRVDRKSQLVEEDATAMENTCSTVQEEIHVLVKEIETLRRKIVEIERDLAAQPVKFKIYYDKMEAHRQIVADYEDSLPPRQRLAELQHKLADHTIRRDKILGDEEKLISLMDGTQEHNISEEIRRVISETHKVNIDIKREREQVEAMHAQEDKIKLDISVLHKRNSAQLTRLRKQTTEKQLRNSQWHEQCLQIEQRIDDTRRILQQ